MNLLRSAKQYLQKKTGHRKSAYLIRCNGIEERQQTKSAYLIVCSGIVDRQSKRLRVRFHRAATEADLDG